MELARVYENSTETDTCFKLETVLAYVGQTEEENVDLKKENADIKYNYQKGLYISAKLFSFSLKLLLFILYG